MLDQTLFVPPPVPPDNRLAVASQVLGLTPANEGNPQKPSEGSAASTAPAAPTAPAATPPASAPPAPPAPAAPTSAPSSAPAAQQPQQLQPPLITPEVLQLLQSQLQPADSLGPGLSIAAIAMNDPQLAAQLLSKDEAARQNALNQLTNLAAQEGATRRAEAVQTGAAKREAARQEGYLAREEEKAKHQQELEAQKELGRQKQAIIKEAMQNPYMPSLSQFNLGTKEEDWQGFLEAFKTAQDRRQRVDLATKWTQQHHLAEDPATLPLMLGMTEDEARKDPDIGPLFNRAMREHNQYIADKHSLNQATIGYRNHQLKTLRDLEDLNSGGIATMKPKDLTSFISSMTGRLATIDAGLQRDRALLAQKQLQASALDPTTPLGATVQTQVMDLSARLSLQEEVRAQAQSALAAAQEELRRRNNDTPGATENFDPELLSLAATHALTSAASSVMADPAYQPLLDAMTPVTTAPNAAGIPPAEHFIGVLAAAKLGGDPIEKAKATVALRKVGKAMLANLRGRPEFADVPVDVLYNALRDAYRQQLSLFKMKLQAGGIDTHPLVPDFMVNPLPPWMQTQAPTFPSEQAIKGPAASPPASSPTSQPPGQPQ